MGTDFDAAYAMNNGNPPLPSAVVIVFFGGFLLASLLSAWAVRNRPAEWSRKFGLYFAVAGILVTALTEAPF